MNIKNITKKIIRYISITFCLFFLYCAFWPLQMTRYTLTDGHKIIVFQSMMHMALPSFYKSVEDDIKSYTSDGYTFLYEGIRPGKNYKENSKASNSLNIPDYSITSGLLGLTDQGADYFIIANKFGYNADVDEDFLIKRFIEEGLIKSEDNSGNKKESSNTSMSEEEFKQLQKYKNIIAFVALPVNRIGFRFNDIERYFTENDDNYDPETRIIIVERNKYLYDNVKICHCNKIYINYGAAHFNNFYNMLKADNKNWHIIEEKNYVVF